MNYDFNQLWGQVLKSIEPTVNEEIFETWLKPIRPYEINKNVLYVEAPNEHGKNYIERRYVEPLEEKLEELTGEKISVFVTLPKLVLLDTVNKQEIKIQNNSFSNMLDEKEMYSVLNPKYTFETFVIGNNNRFAHAACVAVSEAPAQAYNPLFIYGGVGLGKTHLMHAIGNAILEVNPRKRIYYASSEKFTNELIASIRMDKMLEFRNQYRNVDVLLIDDIQFLVGKERTQEEFFHTFNALHDAGKQIVISSDRPPKEISQLEERLRSRFEWGLTTDIQKPDLETRTAILQKKSMSENLEIPVDVLTFIASRIDTNIRELEGALTRVVAYARLNKKEITIDLVSESLKEILPNLKPQVITVDMIINSVAEYYHMPKEDFRAKRRTAQIVLPRHIAMFLSRKLTDISLPKIGEEFGGRDHTTIISACDKIGDMIEKDESFADTVKEITNLIKMK